MLKVFRRNPQAATIEALYGAIVAQARAAVFYLDYRVSDSLPGRLDMLMLHLALAYDRLSRDDAAAKAIGQALFDRFCRDMDDHLREQGFSDLKVPKEMRGVGAAFFGRPGTYVSALRAGDAESLEAGLARNVYQGAAAAPSRALAAYVIAADAGLARQETGEILTGLLQWPDPADFL